MQGSKPECPKKYYETPKCVRKCDNSSIEFENDKYFGRAAYKVNATDIEAEILTNGPVSVTMDVYADFFLYKKGMEMEQF